MDLSKVTFPTFVLEPRSMLERITDFMSHPDLIFGYVRLWSSRRSYPEPGCAFLPSAATLPPMRCDAIQTESSHLLL